MKAVHPNIVVDSSAIMACCLSEAGFEAFEFALKHAKTAVVSAPTRLELGIVAMQRGTQQRVEQALTEYGVEVIAFDESMAQLAIAAFARYGKGRHKAALNFGDCCAYALSQSLRLPLLYKGEDFTHTDVASALV